MTTVIHYGEWTDEFKDETVFVEIEMSEEMTDTEWGQAIWDELFNGGKLIDYPHRTIAKALQSARQQGAEEERERCAQVAKAHKGNAAKKRGTIKQTPFQSDEEHEAMRNEIYAEERGEDIAAEMIEAAIRALEPTP